MAKRRRKITIETREVWIIRNDANRGPAVAADDALPAQESIPAKPIEAITTSSQHLSADEAGGEERRGTSHED
jgi:hypothetical protein